VASRHLSRSALYWRFLAIAATIFTFVVVGASPASAATPVGTRDVSVAAQCATAISGDGLTAKGACMPDAPGNVFRLVVTHCGPSYCRTTKGPWWPQDNYWHGFNPGGYVASVDGLEFA
jgi:hypothetical protein